MTLGLAIRHGYVDHVNEIATQDVDLACFVKIERFEKLMKYFVEVILTRRYDLIALPPLAP